MRQTLRNVRLRIRTILLLLTTPLLCIQTSSSEPSSHKSHHSTRSSSTSSNRGRLLLFSAWQICRSHMAKVDVISPSQQKQKRSSQIPALSTNLGLKSHTSHSSQLTLDRNQNATGRPSNLESVYHAAQPKTDQNPWHWS